MGAVAAPGPLQQEQVHSLSGGAAKDRFTPPPGAARRPPATRCLRYSRLCSRCPNAASASKMAGLSAVAAFFAASCSLPLPSTVNSNRTSSGSSWAELTSRTSIAPLIWGWGGEWG